MSLDEGFLSAQQAEIDARNLNVQPDARDPNALSHAKVNYMCHEWPVHLSHFETSLQKEPLHKIATKMISQ